MIFRALLFGFAVSVAVARAQDIQLYSEFERFGPKGQPVSFDRDMKPREILSPALPRNGHLSVHAVVTAPPGTNYFFYVGANPDDTLQIKVYREHFVRCGEEYCPDWLTEIKTPAFGAIPESFADMPDQTTRAYLLDIWCPPDTYPRRVRVEALIKVGIWEVAPMEVRIIDSTVPSLTMAPLEEAVEPVTARSSDTARLQMLRYLSGQLPQFPPRILTVRDIIQRNAAEDMLLASALGRPGKRFPDLNLMFWMPFLDRFSGAEWYLRVRDFLYRYRR